MPVGADGATVDFNPDSPECSSLGHSFELWIFDNDSKDSTGKIVNNLIKEKKKS